MQKKYTAAYIVTYNKHHNICLTGLPRLLPMLNTHRLPMQLPSAGKATAHNNKTNNGFAHCGIRSLSFTRNITSPTARDSITLVWLSTCPIKPLPVANGTSASQPNCLNGTDCNMYGTWEIAAKINSRAVYFRTSWV